MASLPNNPLSISYPRAQPRMPAQAALSPLLTLEPTTFMTSWDEACRLQVSGPSSPAISMSNLDPRHEFSQTHNVAFVSSQDEMQADTSSKYSSIPIHEAYGARGAPVLSSSGSKGLESARLSLRCLGNEKAHDKKRAMNRTGSCTLTPGDELFGYSRARPPPSGVALDSDGRTLSPTPSSDWILSSDEQPAVPTQPGDSRLSAWYDSPPRTSALKTMESRSTVSKHVTLPHLPLKTTKCTEPLANVKSIIPPSFLSSTAVPSAPTSTPPISRASTPVMQTGCDIPDRDPALQNYRSTLLTLTATEDIPRPHTLYSSTARTPISTPLSALNSTALSRSPPEMISDLRIGDSTLSLPLSPMATTQHLPVKSNGIAPLTLERLLPASINSVSSPPLGRSNSSTGFASCSSHHNSSSFSSLSSERYPLTPYPQHSLQYTLQPYSISTSSLNVASTCTVSPYSPPPTQTPRNMTMKRLLAKPAPPSPFASPPIGHAGYANGSGGMISGDIQHLWCHPNGHGNVDLKEPDIGIAVTDIKWRKQRSGRESNGRLTTQPGREPTPLFTAKRQTVVHDHLPKGDVDMGQQRLSTDTTRVERSYSAVPTLGCSRTETVKDHEQEKPTKRPHNILRRKRSNILTSNVQPTTGLTRSSSRDNSCRRDANRIRSVVSLLSHAIESAVPVRDRDPTGQIPRHFRMPHILPRSRYTDPDMGLGDQTALTPAASLVEEYKAKEKEKGSNQLECCDGTRTTSPTKRNYYSGEIGRTDRGLRRSASTGQVPSTGLGPGHGSPDMARLAAGELSRMVTRAAVGVNELIFPSRRGAVENNADQTSAVILQISKTRSREYANACDDCPNRDSPGVPDTSALVNASRKALRRTTSPTRRRRGVQSDHGHGGSSLPLVQKNDLATMMQERNKQKNQAKMGRGRDRRPLRLSIDKFVDDVDREGLGNGAEKASSKSSGGNKLWRLMRRFSISLPRVKRAKLPPSLPTLPDLLPSSSVAIPWGTVTRPSAPPPPPSRYRVPGRSTSSRSSSSFTSSGHTQSTSRTDFDAPPVPKHPAASALSLHIVNPSALEMACRVDDSYDDDDQKRHKFYNSRAPDIPSPKTPREGDWIRSSSPDIQLSSLPLPPRRTPKPNPEVISLSSIYSTDETPMQLSESPMIPSFSTDHAVNSLPPSPPLTRVSSPSPIDGSQKSTSPTSVIPSILLTTPAPRLRHMENPPGSKPTSIRGDNPSIAFPMSNPLGSSVLPGNQTQVPFTRRRSLSLTDEDPRPSSSSTVNDPSRLNTFHRFNLAPVSSIVTRPGTANTFGVSGGLGVMGRPGTSGSAYSARSGASTITERCLPWGSFERRPSSTSSFD